MRFPSTEFIVAESRFLGNAGRSPTDVCTDLDVAVQPDLRYHFSGPLCAAYWIDLCHSREYRHDRVVDAIESALPQLVQALQNHSARRPRVSLFSLGPGDGEVDIRLLQGLRPAIEIASYRCVDFSFELLEHAVRRILASGAVDGLPVRARCADFTDPDGAAARNGDCDLLLLTGYTFGNNNEARMLSDLAGRMRPGDFLLLDGRLHAFAGDEANLTREQQGSLVKGYDNPASNRFAFGPVETVTTARARDVDFDYRIGRFVTKVPKALNVVTGCRGLEAPMRLTGRVVARDHLDLASTTLYEFESLRDWLAASPLRLRFAARNDETGVFLLEKQT